MDKPNVGEVYEHYKGNRYAVVALGRLEASEEEVVVYRAKDSDQVWVRPLREFIEQVKVGEKTVPRFKKV